MHIIIQHLFFITLKGERVSDYHVSINDNKYLVEL